MLVVRDLHFTKAAENFRIIFETRQKLDWLLQSPKTFWKFPETWISVKQLLYYYVWSCRNSFHFVLDNVKKLFDDNSWKAIKESQLSDRYCEYVKSF
jgi:hypothetical protein